MDAALEIEFPVITKGRIEQDAIEYARMKISKTLLHSSATITHATVRLTREPDPARDRPAIAEVTLNMKGRVIRAHVGAASMPEAIDLLDARLRRRIEEANDRRRALSMRHRDDGPGEWRHGAIPSERPARFERHVDERELVRHKSFAVAHQTIDEAAFDLEALDHDFFLFRDEQTAQSCNDLRRAVGLFDECVGTCLKAACFKLTGARAGHDGQGHVWKFGLEHLNTRHAQGVWQL